MAKLNFSIALNLLTQGIKNGVTEVEGYFKKLRSSIVSTLGGLGIGLGLTEFGRSMIASGKDFEAGMARVRAVTNASHSMLAARGFAHFPFVQKIPAWGGGYSQVIVPASKNTGYRRSGASSWRSAR